MMIKFVCGKCHDDLCKYLNMEIEIMTIPNIAKEKCPICEYRIGKYAINESYIQDYTTMIINFKLTRSMVIEWAKERKLYENSEPKDQTIKLIEELGELSRAILHNNIGKQIDSVGDMLVVMINLCYQLNINPEYCLYKAYEQIKDRKGKMENGTFIKEEDICKCKEKNCEKK